MESDVRTYDVVGGTATIRFSPSSVEVLSASPKPGFTLEPIERSHPTQVRVEFESASHRSRIDARWRDGPAAEIDEDD